MSQRRTGEKKAMESMQKESLKELIHNLKKAVRLDTGSTPGVDAFRREMLASEGIDMKVESAEKIVEWFRRKLKGIREGQLERFDEIERRYGDKQPKSLNDQF